MLRNTNTIDLITDEPGLGLVVEPGEWADPAAAVLLQEKLNTYTAFGLDGEMERRHGSPARIITIFYHDPPPPEVASVLTRLVDLAKDEIEVRQQRLVAQDAA